MRPVRKNVVAYNIKIQESGRNMWTGFIWVGVVTVVSAVMGLWVQCRTEINLRALRF